MPSNTLAATTVLEKARATAKKKAIPHSKSKAQRKTAPITTPVMTTCNNEPAKTSGRTRLFKRSLSPTLNSNNNTPIWATWDKVSPPSNAKLLKIKPAAR